ncbi:glutamate synthase (NADPH/NADH) small chain [Kitasatospora sp. MAP12-15]|uniref:glutamate synthase subunit beta n=1 Tax=unclassified Kitasatospora TaxID=2633591 RepID=UPI00247425A8|nr:glutamate synthase subunit beta [Kitasatospora sp. MAP12-44]MDH6113849.1 glutamate synthase (NADPH/NADH) small chain [Kitasatospora sp. MAP12-44]
MADPKFLSTPRRLRERRSPQERVRDWNEVNADRRLLPIISEQAGRCMDCGIPFCHQACPLGNLIPDWNFLAAREEWANASAHLHATNNFPEFTGRLCPAPCESACVLAIDGDPVTIKNVEAAIADQAWQLGLETPRPPARLSGYSVAVVGSGPAGLAAAQQLTRAGHATTVYERADRIGGLLRYGIPAFRLEKRHLDRRIEQLRAEGTRFCPGTEVGDDPAAEELLAPYDAVVLAVGATAWRELPVPGRELRGIHQAMEYLPLANRVQEGDFERSPISAEGRHVVIVGGGDTAADCLGTVLRQHASCVTQLDINPRPDEARADDQPWPVHPKVYRLTASHEEAAAQPFASGAPAPADADDRRVFSAATLRFEGDEHGDVRALHCVEVEPRARQPRAGTEWVIRAELVLLALGFAGPEHGSALVDRLGLELDAAGNLARGRDFATRRPGVFVAGDAGRGQSLIVWAIAEGRAAAAAVDRYLTGSTALPAPITASDRPLVL